MATIPLAAQLSSRLVAQLAELLAVSRTARAKGTGDADTIRRIILEKADVERSATLDH